MRVLSLIMLFILFLPDDMRQLMWTHEKDHVAHRSRLGVPTAYAEEDYICPMHPFIHGKKGDRCPICGMPLVAAHSHAPQMSPQMSMPSQDMSTHIDPDYIQKLGVRTTDAGFYDFGKTIHAFGQVVPDTRREYSFSVRSAGWVVDLKTSAVGDTVKKGDVLFTYYSPDMITAETDYFASRGSILNLDKRFRLVGMDEEAIALVKAQGKIVEVIPFHAPADGTITALNIRKGAYLKDGDVALALEDFSQVWVEAHIAVKDLPILAVGMPAKITVSETGESYTATVDYIYPETDPDSRKGLARLVVDNPQGKLKTGELTDIMFEADSKSRLSVPDEAVLYDSQGAYVIEALGEGSFQPIKVQTGITADGFTEITDGLEAGKRIVSSGQFLIDAESNLQGGMANMDMGGMDMKNTPPPADNSMKNMPMPNDDMKGMDMGVGHGK